MYICTAHELNIVWHNYDPSRRQLVLGNICRKPLLLPAPTSTCPCPNIKKHCFVGQNAHVHNHGFHLATHSLATCVLNVTSSSSSPPSSSSSWRFPWIWSLSGMGIQWFPRISVETSWRFPSTPQSISLRANVVWAKGGKLRVRLLRTAMVRYLISNPKQNCVRSGLPSSHFTMQNPNLKGKSSN